MPTAPPDPTAMAAAIRTLLGAAGLDPTSEDLRGSPERVARLWLDEFLSGYAMDPAQILGDAVVGEADPAEVLLRDLSFHSLCPHHLVPFRGRAHVAYLPAGRLLGFGRIAQLVACFTQRLTLQERATQQVAQALVDLLPCRGAACVLEAEQLCLALPSDRHEGSRVVTTAFVGDYAARPELQSQFLARLGLRS
ncbi:MAG: GTP cyclohydrolase I [Deltaproteobacteria bacterium]|nr:GTP cyclohydrolase I [Deltaproteobacteria bacterium]